MQHKTFRQFSDLRNHIELRVIHFLIYSLQKETLMRNIIREEKLHSSKEQMDVTLKDMLS